jgi:predicted MPP superfamily phosphohydrolase
VVPHLAWIQTGEEEEGFLTKVSIFSDLHLEFHDLSDLPGGDLLLLCGDVFVACVLKKTRTDGDSRKRRSRFTQFAERELTKYKKVFYVMGNHDHYGGCFEETPELLTKLFENYAPNTKLLNNKAVTYKGVRIIGSSLWATCGYGTESAQAIENGMNDFHLISTKAPKMNNVHELYNEHYPRKFRVYDAYIEHEKSIKFIKT